MAISEFETKRIEKIMDGFLASQRPPVSMRNMVDIGYRLENQSIVIFEIRPQWDDQEKKVENFVAKATFVKSKNEWHLYWLRSDLRWHRYEPEPTAKSLDQFLDVVVQDKHCCFWG